MLYEMELNFSDVIYDIRNRTDFYKIFKLDLACQPTLSQHFYLERKSRLNTTDLDRDFEIEIEIINKTIEPGVLFEATINYSNDEEQIIYFLNNNPNIPLIANKIEKNVYRISQTITEEHYKILKLESDYEAITYKTDLGYILDQSIVLEII